MSKTSGLGDNLYVGGYNISGDIGSIENIACPQKPFEMTGIDKSAIERVGGQRDGAIDFTAWFNTSSGQAHPVLSALPTSNVVSVYARGVALGNAAACMVAKQINYDPKRDADGNLSLTINTLANGYGLEWGQQVVPLQTFSAATTGTASLDTGSAAVTGIGAQAYLEVTAFTGTDATIKLQHSSDNSTWSDITGGGFTQVTAAHTAQRIATSSTLDIKRYIRAVISTSAGFTSLTCCVVIVKNVTATVF